MLRIASAALAGGAMELLFVLLLRKRILFLAASCFAAIPVMVLFAYGRSRIRRFLKNIIFCYGAAFLLGGSTKAIENTWGIQRMPLLAGAAAMLVCIPLFQSMIGEGKRNQNFYAVKLEHNGKVLAAEGLLDTGNLLTDPRTRMPVNILSAPLFQKLALKDADRSGIALYQSLGQSGGTLETYRIDRLSVRSDGLWLHIAPAVIAPAPDGLFCGKDYEVILGAQILEDGILSQYDTAIPLK